MASPKKINKKATIIFNKLIKDLNWENSHKRLGGEIGKDSTFVPVSIEIINKLSIGLVFSIAHYSIQNNDLMADPEVTFLQHSNGKIFPMSYKNDYLGIYEHNMFIEEEKIKFIPQKQHSLAIFCETWIKNIEQQQKL